jgi:transformation/transcription domain-associated protein
VGEEMRTVEELLDEQERLLEGGREKKCSHVLNAIAQLAHIDTPLAEALWLTTFPKIWAILSDRQRTVSTSTSIGSSFKT